MKARLVGKRHPLLFYHRSIDRVWKFLIVLGIFLVLLQQLTGRTYPYLGFIPALPSPYSELAFFAGVALVIGALLIWLARGLAYAQPRQDHLRISTPFTTIKISYRRVRSIHPGNITQIFPPDKIRRSTRSFLEPFFGKTAVVVELNSYPLDPGMMRFFLGAQSLLPNGTGLVLMVPDWMTLSTEIDSIYGRWRHT